jgi:hypothetical protein
MILKIMGSKRHRANIEDCVFRAVAPTKAFWKLEGFNDVKI